MKQFYFVDVWTATDIITKMVRAESVGGAVESRIRAMQKRGYAITAQGADWAEMTNPATKESIRLYGHSIV